MNSPNKSLTLYTDSYMTTSPSADKRLSVSTSAGKNKQLINNQPEPTLISKDKPIQVQLFEGTKTKNISETKMKQNLKLAIH